MKDIFARCLKKNIAQVCTLLTYIADTYVNLLVTASILFFPSHVQNMSCNNRCLFFRRLKINHESQEFILILAPWRTPYCNSVKCGDYYCQNLLFVGILQKLNRRGGGNRVQIQSHTVYSHHRGRNIIIEDTPDSFTCLLSINIHFS
jgi:hypothetical protein